MESEKKTSPPTAEGRRNVTEEERSLGALLRVPYQVLSDRVYGHLAGNGFADIRPAHSAVFRHILTDGSRTTELAEKAQMTKQSMGYLVEYLREHGYVEMYDDPEDGRAKRVRLTARGVAVQQAALEMSRRVEQDFAGVIGAGAMRRLRSLLEELNAGLAGAGDGRDDARPAR